MFLKSWSKTFNLLIYLKYLHEKIYGNKNWYKKSKCTSKDDLKNYKEYLKYTNYFDELNNIDENQFIAGDFIGDFIRNIQWNLLI